MYNYVTYEKTVIKKNEILNWNFQPSYVLHWLAELLHENTNQLQKLTFEKCSSDDIRKQGQQMEIEGLVSHQRPEIRSFFPVHTSTVLSKRHETTKLPICMTNFLKFSFLCIILTDICWLCLKIEWNFGWKLEKLRN